MQVIRSIWADIGAFNKDWQTLVADWVELEAWTSLPQKPVRARNRLRRTWLLGLGRDYYRWTTEMIRQQDPHHLILGVRFGGTPPVEMARAARGWTDALSINVYAADARLDEGLFRGLHRAGRQPVVISEYSFHALDGRSGNRNLSGFIWGHVIDQQARRDAYRLFTTRLASVPFIIGADWFQWNDEPPSGRGDGEDVNFGIVDLQDRPYEELVRTIVATAITLDPIHAESGSLASDAMWRPPTEPRPSFVIPHLSTPIVLDGALAEWDAQAGLGPLRHVPKVGVERSDERRSPQVMIGWREEGLYLGVVVFDRSVQGAPREYLEQPSHHWRIRTFDAIELTLATSPVARDQTWYDEHSLHLVFVTDRQDPSGGTVLRWHHPGDSLAGHVIPDPDVRYGLAWRPDGYAVELLLPASALGEHAPEPGSLMAGNLFIRNWQPAVDHYWAATEFAPPSLWGRLGLGPFTP